MLFFLKVYFEKLFLGHIPANVKIPKNAGHVYGFKGCIQELQVNNKEFFLIDEAPSGKNIENCHIPRCEHHLCRNNGTCVRYVLASCPPAKFLKQQNQQHCHLGDRKERSGTSKFLCTSPRWWCLLKEIYILWFQCQKFLNSESARYLDLILAILNGSKCNFTKVFYSLKTWMRDCSLIMVLVH